ncbi:MAG: LUD domain-containing protein, partial [Desulfuromonadaceae bacterium]|nr:LUD domain-containing protein [Desulfuromonadaceae bacterium]
RQQDALHRFGDAYLEARQQALADHDFEALREGIAELKDEVGRHRQQYLDQFIELAEKAGAQVVRAADASAANDYIVQLARRRRAKLAVKSKSMASEEIGLNQALRTAGVEALETDLGEWIIQLAGQRPSHMVMPAIHMFRDEVAALFGQVTGQAEPADIEHLVAVARQQLRDKFLQADMGISGANLAVAETGALALVTNEGNARLVATLPPVHVVLVGIDKLVPTLEDAMRVLQVLPRSATAQALTSYVSWIRGPVPQEGPAKELHIVLLDNGRSALAEDPDCKDALRCLRCGACANVCPVYQTIGGHVFGHTYVGAIGVVLTAFLEGLEPAAELVKACIGCRACVAICPAKIDLEEMILHLRRRISDQEGLGLGKSLVFRRVLRNRRLFHALLRSAAHLQKPITDSRGSIRHLPLHFSSLTEWRTLPVIADKPLRDLMPAIDDQLSAPRQRVALFAGCATDFVHPQIGLSLVSVLNRCKIAVTMPQGQSCCGIPALYSGDRQTAVELARQNVRELLADDPDAVVTTCPTCTAALRKHFVELLQDDAQYAESARRLAAITYDAAAFIAEQLPDLPAAAHRGTVTYHDSCHLKRGCGVWKEPRQLLAKAGWDLREMDRADRCCGFGGSYSFSGHPEISREITKDKVDSILRSGAEAVAVDCPGCLIMLRGALEKRGLPQRVAHTLELISEALEDAGEDTI